MANGVQAFRSPQARNAAATLGVMGAVSIVMFLGIAALARLFDVRVSEDTIDTYGTVLSQIGRSAFNGGFGFWVLQVVPAGNPDPGRQHRLSGLSRVCRRSLPTIGDAPPIPQPG